MRKSRVRQPVVYAARRRSQRPADDNAVELEGAVAMPLKTELHLRWGRGGGIGDLREAGSSELQNPARIHVIAKDTNAKAVVADEAAEYLRFETSCRAL